MLSMKVKIEFEKAKKSI